MRHRRAGISLTEVLIAMFIMAVGMIALMTLFPLGAMRIGQSLKDDRCTQLALQIDGQMRAVWRNEIVAEIAAGREPREPFFHAMEDANVYPAIPVIAGVPQPPRVKGPIGTTYDRIHYVQNTQQLPAGNNAPQNTAVGTPVSLNSVNLYDERLSDTTMPTPADPYRNVVRGANPLAGPSYPVLIDPYHMVNTTSPNSTRHYCWLSGSDVAAASTRLQVPRRNLVQSPSSVPLTTLAANAFTRLTDDYTFEMNGQAGPSGAGATVARQGRYSAAVMVQRRQLSERDKASMKILVFDGRSPAPTAGDEALASAATGGGKQVRVTVPTRPQDATPTVRRGGWLIDGTIDNTAGINVRRADFHRIVAVTVFSVDTATNTTTYDLDLETDIAPYSGSNYQFYFMAGLTEVYDRADLVPDFNQ